MLELPWSREAIAEAVYETCRANGLQDGYIRLVVTRGEGSLESFNQELYISAADYYCRYDSALP